MAVPRDPDNEHSISVVVTQFRQLHNELRFEVSNRSDESLNWVPCPGANSAATIVTHTLGSEAETLHAVAGATMLRDRDGEFQMGEQSKAALVEQIATADALLDDLGSALTNERGTALVTLPSMPSGDRRSGMTWLIGNLGHAREHMGHVRLTMQLHEAAGTAQA
jgi:DinB superfamily